LTAAAPAAAVGDWTKEIEAAEAERDTRVEAMDVMHTRLKKGETSSFYIETSVMICKIHESAPTFSEIQLNLTEKESNIGTQPGQTSWIAEGLMLEEAQ
jgi:hypothetical protein